MKNENLKIEEKRFLLSELSEEVKKEVHNDFIELFTQVYEDNQGFDYCTDITLEEHLSALSEDFKIEWCKDNNIKFDKKGIWIWE